MKVANLEELAVKTGQKLLSANIKDSSFTIDTNKWGMPNGLFIENNTEEVVYKVYKGIHYGVQGGNTVKVTGFKAKDFAGKLLKKEKTITL